MTSRYGQVEYEAHGHNRKSRGFVGDEAVVEIYKNKNHTHTNSGIYTVVVQGRELPTPFRGIEEARRAGGEAYEKGR